jgi:hypothetical protein
MKMQRKLVSVRNMKRRIFEIRWAFIFVFSRDVYYQVSNMMF